MTEKRFTTIELQKPNKWGIWYDGAYLSTYQVCILLNEYVDVKKMNDELKIDVNSLLTHYNGLNAEYEWLKEENEELKKENEELSVMKLKGLKVLEFYEDKLKNADRKEFENAREELWIVKEVLCEMEVIKE